MVIIYEFRKFFTNILRQSYFESLCKYFYEFDDMDDLKNYSINKK